MRPADPSGMNYIAKEPLALPTSTRYRVDAAGLIREVGADWDRFAELNGAPWLAGGAVVGRPLADFIDDVTSRHLYELLLARARAGRPVTIPFRCDGPAVRREMVMQLHPAPDGAVDIETRVRRETARPPVALLDRSAPRAETLPVTMCGWCNRVRTGPGTWQEVEDAVAALRLLSFPAPPPLSHGICPTCREAVEAAIG